MKKSVPSGALGRGSGCKEGEQDKNGDDNGNGEGDSVSVLICALVNLSCRVYIVVVVRGGGEEVSQGR